MLRVLTLSTLFPDASRPNFGIFVEQQTLALAARADVEVRVVAPIGLPPWPLSALPQYRALAALPVQERWKGLPIRRPRFLNLPATQGRFHPLALARAIAPLLRQIRRDFPFDLIDAEFFYPDGPAAVRLGRRFGVPVSIKARGADIQHWGSAPATAGQVRRAGLAADGMLAVSDALRNDMAALGLPRERIALSLTGVDHARFGVQARAEAKAALGIAGPLVLATGALIPRKGHDLVIDAVATLPGVQLRIAGQGPARERLQARIDALGIGDRAALLGSVPHAAIPNWFAAADVMALASASEGLANAWVEALASGTPVVSPDIGGAREVVQDDSAGRIVARTPQGLADGIAALLAAPPAPDSVRRSAARFTWPANAEALEAHFRRLVAMHGTGARSAP
jgi:teichuronic acid biosynthesis glycosyltransferase TuaC